MERVSSATVAEVEDSLDAISTDQSGRSGKKRAKVWAYVDSEIVDGIEKAVCKYCKLQLSSVSGKGTTHLNRHIGYYCHHIPQDFVRFFYLTVENAEAEVKMRELRQYLKKYYLEYERVVRNNTGPVFVTYEEEVLSQGESSSSGLRGKRRVELAFAQFSSHNSSTRSERSELDIYLDDPRVVVRPTKNFNVLAWWKKNSDAYPILSLMARDFLSIPVSTVSSESAFSAAGRILGKNRTSLSPETLEALVCAKDWLIGFNDAEEGQPMTGQRMFESDEEEDD